MTTINLNDQQQRNQALNPAQSFIVQAPAGSGKTELLTQRFLQLLSYVETVPEEILAITFTRKAAAEMRLRIIDVLKMANSQPEPKDAHLKKTWNLAKQVLSRNKLENWNLLENSNRLRVQTIDSLCSSLTAQMPFLSRFGAQPKIIEDAEAFYRQAVREVLLQINDDVSWSRDIYQLLSHLDNRFDRAEKLLVEMLEKRDQWLPHITTKMTYNDFREILEFGLKNITKDCLENCYKTVPKTLAEELIFLARFASAQLKIENKNSPITACETLKQLPGLKEKSQWLGFCELLLKKDKAWRKEVDKKIGFPSSSSTKNKASAEILKAMKVRMQVLLESLQRHEDFRAALAALRDAPPICYEEKQWNILLSLVKLLPITAAQLKLVFREAGQVDFSEVSQAALFALGSSELPSDLTLSLDYKIRHILVDEFQDTSNHQFHLLEKLTSGWRGEDGRTLFVVGDPMQSIYRFREAEVGLFLRARHEGIGQIRLIPLTLSTNFRSEKKLVTWFNQTFESIFPSNEDISAGAVTYSSASAFLNQNNKAQVKIHALINSDAKTEAEQIAELVLKCKQDNPNGTIAILAKARTHLTEIFAALRMQNIAYQAVDIDPLSSRPIVRELFALTCALLRLADRVAWYAILRAPWCGLTLCDLHVLANEEKNLIIWERINNIDVFSKLSSDGQKRLSFLRSIITSALQQQHRKKLRDWIHETWLALNGSACIKHLSDLEDAKAYYRLLESVERAGDIQSISDLQNKINKAYAVSAQQAANPAQIMTIHKAKGLEFDTVIIPQLQRIFPKNDSQLLLWAERINIYSEDNLILAPIKSFDSQKEDAIYKYLREQEALKSQNENVRLLYVAATRAKQQLHLFGNVNYKNELSNELKTPAAGSFLKQIWPQIKEQFIHEAEHRKSFQKDIVETASQDRNIMTRLNIDVFSAAPLRENFKNNQNAILLSYKLSENIQRHIGTVVHRILQQISLEGVSLWPRERVNTAEPFWCSMLSQMGVIPAKLDYAVRLVRLAIDNTLSDSRGCWILQPHQDALCEYALSTTRNNQLECFVVDRTFIDEDNQRWIIDYKAVNYQGKHLSQFLQNEKDKYQSQLGNYAVLLSQPCSKKIHFGLYFPLLPDWIEW